jgi:hypothetical protein
MIRCCFRIIPIVKFPPLAVVLAVAAALAVFAPMAHAQGGPPLLTDDPGTPGNGDWEINVAALDYDVAGQHTLQVPQLDMNYGAGVRTQLKLQVPWLVQTGNGPTYTEAGGPLLGVKYRFFDQEKSGVDVSTYPQLQLNSPGAQRIMGRDIEFLLPIEVVRTQGKFEFDGEAGFNFRQHGLGQWLLGFAVGYQGPKKWEWLAEVHAINDRDFDDRQFLFQAGFRRELSRRYSALFAIGRGLPGSVKRQPTETGYLGIQFRLGKNVPDE